MEKLKPRLEELQQSLDKTVSGMRPSTPERETHTGGAKQKARAPLARGEALFFFEARGSLGLVWL